MITQPSHGPILFISTAKILCRTICAVVVVKEALEGHYIYDGGYFMLHLSYSRHTDLNVKA
ncbi:hypothetical protein GIB67_032278 [Kingdonia uniflora]|uniref:Uncharacterized protein n=1 Tax=Kingdonia uniflora TaxID=39325 RepID=A0A7J7MXF6_9MAGN|nr:hypothetical protein GIB67_032278 [Kingdonia uniflora]